jgi:hypothetical protein
LAVVALLAVVVSAVVSRSLRGRADDLPVPVGSYSALAGPAVFRSRTDCGQLVEARTEGVALAALPCGARLYISYRGRRILTRVIGHGPLVPGREFDLTAALARKLGLAGVEEIRWSYAQAR